MEIYCVKLVDNLTDFQYKAFLSKISVKKQNQVKRYRYIKDSLRCLLGDILIRKIAINKFNVVNEEIVFDQNQYGKPYIKNFYDFHYNISHSGEWIVCAIDSKKIGVDIQVIEPIDYTIFKKFFSSIEFKNILSKRETERINYFYDLWTLKESYIKMVGKGFEIPLNTFSILFDNGIEVLDNNSIKKCYNFNLINLDYKYKLAVCSVNPNLINEIKLYNISDLLEII